MASPRKSKAPGKHLGYHGFLEALEQRDCALCFLAERSAERYFCQLFHEGVTDPETLDEIRKAGGYCREHSALLLRSATTLGAAMVYEDLMSHYLARRNAERWDGEAQRCPACRVESEAARRHAQEFLAWKADEAMWSAYRESFGFCVEHLTLVLSLADPPTGRRVQETHSLHARRLVEQLREAIRKADYRCALEPTGEERDAWIRAVRFLRHRWRR